MLARPIDALGGVRTRCRGSRNVNVYTTTELTEEGLHTEDVIGVEFTAETLTQEEVERIRNRVRRGGLDGRLVASDGTAAMVVGDAAEVDPETGEKLDRLVLAARVESEVRQKLSDDAYEVHLVGAPTMIGDIANGVQNAILFLLPLALLLTALLLYAWTRSLRLTMLPLACSLVSLIWQLGFAELSDAEKALGLEIIGNLNDDGYLEEELETLAEATGQSFEVAEKVLSRIQACLL